MRDSLFAGAFCVKPYRRRGARSVFYGKSFQINILSDAWSKVPNKNKQTANPLPPVSEHSLTWTAQ